MLPPNVGTLTVPGPTATGKMPPDVLAPNVGTLTVPGPTATGKMLLKSPPYVLPLDVLPPDV
jgi:hypothetical protein